MFRLWTQYLLLAAGLLLQAASAEYEINLLGTRPFNGGGTVGLETVILVDPFLGCVSIPFTAQDWFKADFDNFEIARSLQGFASTDCSGPGVGIAQGYGTTPSFSLKVFDQPTINSIRITSGNSKRNVNGEGADTTDPSFTLDGNRQLVPINNSTLNRRAIDGFNLVINGDRFLNRLTTGLFATWQYGNIEHGQDDDTPLIPSNPDLWATWARAMGTEWATGTPTGGINDPMLEGDLSRGNRQVAGYQITLRGGHGQGDITQGTMVNMVWRALEYADANSDTWISFDIYNWTGSDRIASVIVWMFM